MSTQLQAVLQRHFGFSEFRTGQREVINAILAGQSAAAIFPTGSGKSLCYQVPAILLPHLTLVVSPLLALMQDQLAFLQAKGIRAASIDSSQTREQTAAVMNDINAGQIKVLMISVERLNNERFRQFIAQVPISLLVVDEAHCISEWGHNFRPDYLKLPQYRQALNIGQTLLLTATATEKVVADMGEKFAIARENIMLTGFYRANLQLEVKGVVSEEKLDYLGNWLAGREQQSGIIYVTLQHTAEQVAKRLAAGNIAAQAYHAGMTSEQRQYIQQQFMAGECKLIVATIAFGMGIDKSDIRYVVHFDLPKSIENYAQEIGRAGRDNAKSDCLVLASGDNLTVLENFVYGDTPELSAIHYVLNDMVQSTDSSTQQWQVVLNSLSTQANIRLLSLKTLLVYLELLGIIKPAYSFFAEYKFKKLQSAVAILARFQGERRSFVQAILQSADEARTWSTMNFERLEQHYPGQRNRVITALDYLDTQGLIELQSKQMTDVYQVNTTAIDCEQLSHLLFRRFADKEKSEINRIKQMVNFFTSERCLSQQLARYFADNQLQQHCGHCSVCFGQPATLPPAKPLKYLNDDNFAQLSAAISAKLANHCSATLLSRFFCGFSTPIFTRLKARNLYGFAIFEQHRFAQVLAWVEKNLDGTLRSSSA